MNIEEKIKEHELNRILVVDDTKENLEGAREYFNKLNKLIVDYAHSSYEAIKKLRDPKNEYSLIITDMEMEEKESGYDVIREGIINNTLGVIATGLNYDPHKNDRHGPKTTFFPRKKIINGKKTNPEVWEKSIEHAIKYLDRYKLKKALDENRANNKKTNPMYADLVVSLYKAEKKL